VVAVSSADLVVLGAGPAGLAAAWRAARAGLSTVVLDRAAAVGGMAASFEVAGVRVDHGSHRLHPATAPHILADLRGLLGEDLQLRPRNGRLRVAGSWVSFPLRPAELAGALPPRMVARIVAEAVTGPLRRDEPTSYADVLRRGLGATVYDALYGPYAEKLWGLPGEEIDAEQARRRVTADTPWKVAARMLRRDRSGPGRAFHYPRRGFGQIVEALAQAATDAGTQIRLGAEVDRVVAAEDGVSVGTADGATHTGGQLFTTVPLPVLARVTEPAPDPSAVHAASTLRFRSMVLLYLVHSGRPWTAFDAHYLPGRGTPITRISEPANYRDSAADPAGRTVLCCELPCAAGDTWWTAAETDLVDVATRTFAEHGLPPLRLEGVHVRRLRHVYPVYATGYAEHLTRLDAWADALPRVTTFGRLGLFAHDNTHHAVAMAYDAVDALRHGSVDPVAWSAARRRFADHVVED
jgi:protoporphyrinogen oxidase